MRWGTLGLLNAERRLLAHSLLDPHNYVMVVLSERCIPLFSFSFIYNYLVKSGKSFITVAKCPIEGKTWSKRLLPEVPKKIWRKGDTWKSVTRKVARAVLSDTKYFPKFALYYGCKKCNRPMRKGLMDERYIPTLTYATMPSEVANRTVFWVNWAAAGDRYHPPLYRYANISGALIREIKAQTIFYPFLNKSSEGIQCRNVEGKSTPCYLFARKFAPGTLKPLLRISKEVMGY